MFIIITLLKNIDILVYIDTSLMLWEVCVPMWELIQITFVVTESLRRD